MTLSSSNDFKKEKGNKNEKDVRNRFKLVNTFR